MIRCSRGKQGYRKAGQQLRRLEILCKDDLKNGVGELIAVLFQSFPNPLIEILPQLLGKFEPGVTELGINAESVKAKQIGIDLSPIAGLLKKDAAQSQAEVLASSTPKVLRDYFQWKLNEALPSTQVSFTFASEMHLSLLGMDLYSKLDIAPLFSARPGLGFNKIRVNLGDYFGGESFPTGMDVLVNSEAPNIDPKTDVSTIRLPIPSLKLTDQIRFRGLEMALTYGKPAWRFTGKGGFGISGFAEGMRVELELIRPNEANRTGIEKAMLTLRLENGQRIPIGTTGLYMSGLMGAIYDGNGQPALANRCIIGNLPSGLKAEMAIFVEAQSPELMNGHLGFWVQLNQLNFGIDGRAKLLQRVADAGVCAALYNNGRNFKGVLDVHVGRMLTVDGHFEVDIWTEQGSNYLCAH